MRHLSPTRAVAALACGMGEAAPAAALVTPSGGPHRLAAGLLRAAPATVDIPPVAAAADHHLTATAGAVEPTGGVLHRQPLPMRTGLWTPRSRYWDSGRATHGLGVRHRGDLPVRAGAAPVSTAPTVYTKVLLFVTYSRCQVLPLRLITNARFRGCAVHHPRWRYPALFTNYAQVSTAIHTLGLMLWGARTRKVPPALSTCPR
jgi:hypothetical protein